MTAREPSPWRRSPNLMGLVAALLSAAAPGAAVLAQSAPPAAAPRIPLVTGLVLGSVLHSPIAEREDVLDVRSADATGVHYAWHERTISTDGDTTTGFRKRFVRANDLAGAPRFDDSFGRDEVDRPGFTALTLSAAVYRQLQAEGQAAFSMVVAKRSEPQRGAPALAGLFEGQRVKYKGSLTKVSTQPDRFPLVLNGTRVTLPALHLRGTFLDGLKRTEWELWVLADSTHPLLLKSVLQDDVFQMVRADVPEDTPAKAGSSIDGTLLTRELREGCRLELPGVYFAFGTAAIDPISDRSLAALARALADHLDWEFTVEGHTDSVGTAAANQALSQRRAEAVRGRLAERHGVKTSAWAAVGYGASRPKESNATIEGRARNRRVELARDCR